MKALLTSLIMGFCLIVPYNFSSAQTAGLEFSYGYSSYQMNNIQQYFETNYQESPLTLKTKKSDFPSGENYGGTFVVGVGKFEAGIDYRKYSTLGELEGTDVNGAIVNYSHNLKGHSIGLLGKYPFIESGNFHFKAGLLVSMYASDDHIVTTTATAGTIDKTDLNYEARSIAITPFVEPVYYLKKWVYVGLRANYAYDFGGELFEPLVKANKFLDQDDNPVKLNWTGFRADVFIGFRINNE